MRARCLLAKDKEASKTQPHASATQGLTRRMSNRNKRASKGDMHSVHPLSEAGLLRDGCWPTLADVEYGAYEVVRASANPSLSRSGLVVAPVLSGELGRAWI